MCSNNSSVNRCSRCVHWVFNSIGRSSVDGSRGLPKCGRICILRRRGPTEHRFRRCMWSLGGKPVLVYNFQVEDYHTYYVTKFGVLVHNKCNYNHGDSVGTSKAPKQGDPGSTYTQISSDGKNTVCSQTTYNEYCMPGTRVDYNHTHGSIGAPHIHVFSYADINGTIRRTKETILPF